MYVTEVNIMFGAVVPSRDAEAEQVEVGWKNDWKHRRTASGLLFQPGLL